MLACLLAAATQFLFLTDKMKYVVGKAIVTITVAIIMKEYEYMGRKEGIGI